MVKDFKMDHHDNVSDALRKANELISDGKKELALQTLKEFVSNAHNRVLCQGYKQLMIKILYLCTELREDETARDMLLYYLQMCQQKDVPSLTDVLLYYLKLADDKARITKLQLQDLGVKDFDLNEAPERLLLAMAAEEEPLGRTGYFELTPWLRYLWESYKNCLHLLSNNQRVEMLYHTVLERAFYYCLKYDRKSEFCELADIMMYHKELAQKYHDDETSVKLSKFETVFLYVKSHFVQLEISIELQLWQQACTYIANIQKLIASSGCYPKPAKFAVYMKKAAMVFWKSNNIMFHAAALLQEFSTRKQADKAWFDKRNKMAVRLATRILLAVLSISEADCLSTSAQYFDDDLIDRSDLIKTFFKRPGLPLKRCLVEEMMYLGVDLCAMPEMLEFYEQLQIVQNPLLLAQKLRPYLRMIEECGYPDYQQYLDKLYSVICIKIVKQLSRFYKTIPMEKLYGLIPYFSEDRLERELADASKRNIVDLRMNYMKRMVEFGAQHSVISGEVEDEVVDNTVAGLPVMQALDLITDVHENLQRTHCPLNKVASDEDIVEEREKSADYMKLFRIFRAYFPEDQCAILCEKFNMVELRKEYREIKRRILSEGIRDREKHAAEKMRLKREEFLNMEREGTFREGKSVILQDLEKQSNAVGEESGQNANELKTSEKDCSGDEALSRRIDNILRIALVAFEWVLAIFDMRMLLTRMLEDAMKDIDRRGHLERSENTNISEEQQQQQQQQLNERQQCRGENDLPEISKRESCKLGLEEEDKKPKVEELTKEIVVCRLDDERFQGNCKHEQEKQDKKPKVEELSSKIVVCSLDNERYPLCRPNVKEIKGEMTWNEYLVLLKEDLARSCLEAHRDPGAEIYFLIEPVIRNEKREILIFKSTLPSSSTFASYSEQPPAVYQVEVKYKSALFVELDGRSRRHQCKFTYRNDLVRFLPPNTGGNLPGKSFQTCGMEPPDDIPVTLFIGVKKTIDNGSERYTCIVELHELVLCRKPFQQKSPKLIQIKNQPAFQFATLRCSTKSIAGLPHLSTIPEIGENNDDDDDGSEDQP
ncbi:Eukaryotic translation initiation factor 3 subunit A [Trichinella murrelli]|uniref:Eukaryotic translation initiation factor 3 subunit A n=1 Tax=Trichinella murrelli TaxID=144512 RepID=A0A0V0TME9_9BILA|nr:Eukaryotic translation initiation factor 3 subunit A [Trichinella murrelli]